MSDTTVTTEAPISTTPPPLPNDALARSPTGEILEPAQIQAQEAAKTTPEAKPTTPAPDATSTSKPDPAAKTDPNAKAPTGAPETYAAFTAPEGYTLDAKAIEAATPVFKELGLSQEAAQRIVSLHAEQMIAASKAPQTTYETMRNDWQAKAKADPDMAKAVNGDKTGLEAVKLDMGRALNAIGDPTLAAEFKDAMNLTGAGDHPAFIKTFWKLAQFVTEGKHVAGAQPSIHGQRPPGTTERPPQAKSLYPNLPG